MNKTSPTNSINENIITRGEKEKGARKGKAERGRHHYLGRMHME